MIKIETITPDLAEGLCRKITVDLPEYFGLPEVNEHYAIGVHSRLNLAARVGEEYVGLISIDFPYPENANIYWMGILQDYHRTGIGKILSYEAFKQAKNRGAKTISVETLSLEETDENYLKTYQFYRSLGFAPLFNLKPEGYEWNMVYMFKSLDDLCENRTNDVLIRPLIIEDIVAISESFNQIGWNKPPSLFEEYLKEQEAGERFVWVAHVYDQFAGYITLKWQSGYPSFKAQNIPEIMDLNVLPSFRKMGIGSLLLDIAEKEAATRSDTIGIGVGLYAGSDGGYGAAQRLYIKRGYIPDGKGVTYNYEPTIPGNRYQLDDDLVLWFTKKLG
ncbi:Predicted acetyltransferase [Legionella pneumophila]|uniref:GNAT family N-acetyltransferase n=1 Tax=Legionella pneumophila TaxID=446 RepID=UPI000770873A|nr:GNAT family N-acetyltransferase [Legionella pneumophila]CZP95437.1 Predicted acetyltransferase [Legionella pneumophila]